MRIVTAFFCLFIPFLLNGQMKKVYWVEKNLQFESKNNIEINEHDSSVFQASSDNFKLSIWKIEHFLIKEEMEDCLLKHVENKGFLVSGKVTSTYKDFLSRVSCQVKNQGYWGIFFLLKEELNHDDSFLGFLTTATKPTVDQLRMIENIKVLEDGNLNMSYYGEDVKTNKSIEVKIQNDLMTLIQKYSPDLFNYADYYYKLSSDLNGKELRTTYLLSSYFPDSIPFHTLYKKSGFIFNLISSLNSQLSTIAEYESKDLNSDTEIFSFMPVLGKRTDIEKMETPPASIINRTFPSKFKAPNYSDNIFPSSLNKSTQLNGILGLESMFIANCYEVKWYNDFLSYYRDKEINTVTFYLDYLYSFPDFCYEALSVKHYIIKYLSVLQKEMPDIYLRLYNNANFRFLIKYNFSFLDQYIQEFNDNKMKIREEIGNQYLPFQEDETKLLINDLQYSNNDALVLFNSLVNFIDDELNYQKTITDFEIQKGQLILIIRE